MFDTSDILIITNPCKKKYTANILLELEGAMVCKKTRIAHFDKIAAIQKFK